MKRKANNYLTHGRQRCRPFCLTGGNEIMTEREARNKIVGIFTGWAGKKEADERHKSNIDIYNVHTPLEMG